MTRIVEFKLKHPLHEDEAIEAMFEMMDTFEDSDDFDELDWDDQQNVAFFANEALEVEIFVGFNMLEIYAEIYNPDYSDREFERDIRKDLVKFFDVEGRSNRQRRGGRNLDRTQTAEPQNTRSPEPLSSPVEESSVDTAQNEAENKLEFRRGKTSGRKRRMDKSKKTQRRERREHQTSQDSVSAVSEEVKTSAKETDQETQVTKESSGFSWFWIVLILSILGIAGYVLFTMLNA